MNLTPRFARHRENPPPVRPAHSPPFRAVAFDLDGLMFDTEALFFRVATAMLADRGKAFTPDIMAAMIGRQAPIAVAAFKEMAGLSESVEDLIEECRARFFERVHEVRPMPGLMTLLSHLDACRVLRCVATSSHREYANHLLESHDLKDQFSFILAAEDIQNSKPAPDIYLAAIQRFGIEPLELLVLEDSNAGTAAALAAGAFAVGIPHDHSPAKGLAEANLLADRLDDPKLLHLFKPL